MENRTRNFLLAVHELYRSYRRGQLSAVPSRDIIGSECKQKREPARLSGGNQLRNCWSQAVLTGPRGGAIYQINRGERKRFHRRRMMEPAAAQRAPYVRKRPGVGVRKWKATCVSRARQEGGRSGGAAHPRGTRDIETSCQPGLYREYCPRPLRSRESA